MRGCVEIEPPSLKAQELCKRIYTYGVYQENLQIFRRKGSKFENRDADRKQLTQTDRQGRGR